MKVTFLGRNGSIQSPFSSNSSLFIQTNYKTILVDTSGNLFFSVKQEPDYILITHEHIDHLYALPSFIHQSWINGRKKELTIFAKNEALDIVNNFISLFSLQNKANIFKINVKEITEIKENNFILIPFKTDHTNSSYGFILKENDSILVYTSDTRPNPIIPLDSNDKVSILITEASGLFTEEETLIKKGHQSGTDALNLAKSIKAEKLFILHLPPSEEKSEQIKKESMIGIIPNLLTEYTIN